MNCSTDMLYRMVLPGDLLCLSSFAQEKTAELFVCHSAKGTSFILCVLRFEIYFDIKHPGARLEYHTSKLRIKVNMVRCRF